MCSELRSVSINWDLKCDRVVRESRKVGLFAAVWDEFVCSDREVEFVSEQVVRLWNAPRFPGDGCLPFDNGSLRCCKD